MKPTQKVLVYLSRKVCATLEDITNDVGIDENKAKVILSRLARDKIITRKWIKNGKSKRRLYCLNTTVAKELHV